LNFMYVPVIFSCCLLSLASVAPAQTPPAPAPAPAAKPSVAAIEGSWEGSLKIPVGDLRLRLNVSRGEGGLKATLDSIDQGARGIPVSEVSFAEGRLVWRIANIGASYEGQLNEAGDLVTGTFNQGAKLTLNLRRLTAADIAASAPKRPQTPKPPYPYRSEDVEFSSKAAGIKLAGTLTIPAGPGPHPGLVLISGSGAQDRDETLFDHKPFAVIADHLARQGVAVLRYDDRGTAKSGGTFKGATTLDFALDAEGAFEYLRTRKELASAKLGLGGHSEGGVVAPLVAARRTDVAFLVLLAGTGVPGDQILYAQGAAILRASKAPEEAIATQRKMQEAMFRLAATEMAADEVVHQIQETLGTQTGISEMAHQVTEPWFRAFLRLDPAVALAQVKCPVLVLNGELDLQVLPDQNVPAIEAALKKGGDKLVEVKRLPKLNHLFQTANTGGPAEYSQIEESFSPVALEAMSSFLRRTTGLK
jgi:pimeloyl-ACP methyl ester carboxylesterase